MHDPHHVYLDLDVINNDYKHDGAPPYLRFEEIRNTPFLDGDSSEYFCSIVRFTIQTGNTLPVIIPRIANPIVHTLRYIQSPLNVKIHYITVVKHSLRRRPSYTNQRTRRPRLSPIPRGVRTCPAHTTTCIIMFISLILLIKR